MNRLIFIILFITTMLLTASLIHAQETPNDKALRDKIDKYLSKGVPNGFSGSVLILKKDQVILQKAFGMADKENKIPYTLQTVATIGSVTKQFTATAILKLEESNKLKLTDSLTKFFSPLPEDKKDITIHQLLTHTAGFIDAIGDGDFDNIPMDTFFKTLFSSKLLHHPGTKYAYSNAAYSILARIIELVSNQDYENYLQENLFQPAGMTQTGYFIPEWEDDLIAKGYLHGIIGVGSMIQQYQRIADITWNLKGNGGIHSTIGDMHKWYVALKSNKILSNQSFEKLTSRHVKENQAGTSYYGYGWAINESNRRTKIISHNGGNGIYFHDFIWLVEEDILIILFTNAGSKETELAWTIEKMLFDKTYVAEPIKKNLHLFTIDFIQNNNLKDANLLIDTLKQKYRSSITHSYILNDLGYNLMRLDLNNRVEWALKIFKLNVELFPKDGNNWDSLGEAYLLNEQKKLALKSYKKALALAPDSNCNWCKSSARAIKKLSKKE